MFETNNYYQENFDNFINNTKNIDLSDIYYKFTDLIPKNSVILDLGCGSGRDSKYFNNLGYQVIAVDNNLKFVEYTRKYACVNAYQLSFSEIDYKNTFDAIWACASLLHEKRENLLQIFNSLSQSLKENGVLYASFKYGDFSGFRNGRFFTDINEKILEDILNQSKQFKLLEKWVTNDKRKNVDEKWLNILLMKGIKNV